MDKPKVFISHITEEKELALVLKRHISEDFLGLIDVFVSSDGTSISLGNKWLDDVGAALADAQAEILLDLQHRVCEASLAKL